MGTPLDVMMIIEPPQTRKEYLEQKDKIRAERKEMREHHRRLKSAGYENLMKLRGSFSNNEGK